MTQENDLGMNEKAAAAASQELFDLMRMVQEGKVIALGFAVEYVTEDQEGILINTRYAHFQVTDGLVASLHKLDALVTAKSMRAESRGEGAYTISDDTDA